MKVNLPLLCTGALLCSVPLWVNASETGEHATAHETEHHAGYHKNVIGLFTGITHENRGSNEFAVGLEYERRFTEHFGIGAVVEYTGGDADTWVYALPFAWHIDRWKFYVAPGIEDGHHGKEDLIRLGGEYAFHLSGGWEIAPQVNVDLVDGEDIWVFGAVFALGF
jgi:hypothetical protein